MGSLARLSGSEADAYKDARPTYADEWYQMLASKTHRHELAWDVGTGNGQAAYGLADYYRRVVATDINAEQLRRAKPHLRVEYYLTPTSMSVDDLVALLGGDNSVDLVTAAQAAHYFDFDKFYAVVKRVLRKPGGIIAVWVFNHIEISPPVDHVFNLLAEKTKPYRDDRTDMALSGYSKLPFPFVSVGIGSEGKPVQLNLRKVISLDGFLSYLKSWQLIVKAKQKGDDLLTPQIINELTRAWGPNPVRTVVYKFYMIAGRCSLLDLFQNIQRPPLVLTYGCRPTRIFPSMYQEHSTNEEALLLCTIL